MTKYKYTVTWYDIIEDKEINSEGYVFEENFVKAADHLIQYYGNDEISSFSLKWEDCSGICEIKSSE